MKRRKKSIPTIRTQHQISVEEDEARVSISDLPIETLTDIQSRLSVKSIFRCRSVCKLWLQILLSHDFAKLHFSRANTIALLHNSDTKSNSKALYLVDFERDRLCHVCDDENRPYQKRCAIKKHFKNNESHVNMKISTRFMLPNLNAVFQECNFSVVNSCNGLLCLQGSGYIDPIVIYNPVTGEYSVVPENEFIAAGFRAKGLGFCPKTKQYKVLVLDNNVALVYRFGLGTWRRIGEAPGALSVISSPAYLNGAIYWVFSNYTHNSSIIYFDFDGEQFHFIPSSRLLSCQGLTSWAGVGTLRGQIFICDQFCFDFINVWAMNNDSALISWLKMFQIDKEIGREIPFGAYKPINFLKHDVLLIYVRDNTFISYDGHDSRLRYFKIRRFRSRFQVTPHIPSFISLKEVLGDSIEVSNVRSRLDSSELHEGKAKPLLLVEDTQYCGSHTDSDC